ncbi:hypothetical protein M419DRAFT_118439 [Trichoderma reesei RUT C-30]|uniref:Uncharacterized protein n=1 Tax=Hypocrea jecorina (strain ATCC 56765 / BCRC 32924 / NRRL 11460 / Rut C-30) TaxID=1344414 RepID=A0A024SCH3_HYPJR|nr:hypothetical protein M419DRAFT_118439 [Trichoderma reesei RUT C-30]
MCRAAVAGDAGVETEAVAVDARPRCAAAGAVDAWSRSGCPSAIDIATATAPAVSLAGSAVSRRLSGQCGGAAL